MKVNPVSFIQNKKGLAGLVCVTLLITAAVFIQNLSSRIRQITVLGEGVQTCYQRIHQTYTARILGDTSAPYLEESFLSSTQECLADSMSYFEAHLEGFLTGGVTLLNEVNELTHEFNTKLASMEGNPENVVASVLGRRFERLETKKDEFLERLEGLSGNALASYSSLKWSFFLLIGLVSFFFIGELWNSFSLARNNEELEGRAQDMLHDPSIKAEQVETFLTEALESNGLPRCALLVNGSARQNKKAVTQEELPKEVTLKAVPVLGNTQEEINAQADAIWDMPETVITNDVVQPEAVSLNEVLTNSLELLSSRFVTSAVSLDTNVTTDLSVFGNEEEVEQIIYLLLNQTIKNCDNCERESHLSINAKNLGSTVFLNLFDSGKGFSKDFLDFNRGLSADCPEDSRDLLIVKEFAKELKADLTFENLQGSNGDIVGSKVQVAFRSPGKEEKSGRRLVSLKKGKKRDLEAALS